jgi:hypothetical protein
VCGPACAMEALGCVLLRIHGTLSMAFRQALHDWQAGTGLTDVMLVLLSHLLKTPDNTTGANRATLRVGLAPIGCMGFRAAPRSTTIVSLP